jgi:hypothetical protein
MVPFGGRESSGNEVLEKESRFLEDSLANPGGGP